MSHALSLFDVKPHFGGITYEARHDEARLSKQLEAVKQHMLSREWVTLEELSVITGAKEQSVSARLRDLRKPEFGGYIVERKRIDGGLFAYRVRK